MSEPLNLGAIEARAKAATPGPWTNPWTCVGTARKDGFYTDAVDTDAWVCVPEYYDGNNLKVRKQDAAFIAAAREDVPALVAEVRRLCEALNGDEPARVWDARIALAASRAVFVALTVPALPLVDAARRFSYEPRTPMGDVFEAAFLWAHEEQERDR